MKGKFTPEDKLIFAIKSVQVVLSLGVVLLLSAGYTSFSRGFYRHREKLCESKVILIANYCSDFDRMVMRNSG